MKMKHRKRKDKEHKHQQTLISLVQMMMKKESHWMSKENVQKKKQLLTLD